MRLRQFSPQPRPPSGGGTHWHTMMSSSFSILRARCVKMFCWMCCQTAGRSVRIWLCKSLEPLAWGTARTGELPACRSLKQQMLNQLLLVSLPPRGYSQPNGGICAAMVSLPPVLGSIPCRWPPAAWPRLQAAKESSGKHGGTCFGREAHRRCHASVDFIVTELLRRAAAVEVRARVVTTGPVAE